MKHDTTTYKIANFQHEPDHDGVGRLLADYLGDLAAEIRYQDSVYTAVLRGTPNDPERPNKSLFPVRAFTAGHRDASDDNDGAKVVVVDRGADPATRALAFGFVELVVTIFGGEYTTFYSEDA